MNKTDFVEISKFEDNIEKKSNKLLNDDVNGKTFYDIFYQPVKKFWLKILFIEFRILIMLKFLEKVNKTPKLYMRLKSEFREINEFQNSIQKCDFYIYQLMLEFEKLNFKNS